MALGLVLYVGKQRQSLLSCMPSWLNETVLEASLQFKPPSPASVYVTLSKGFPSLIVLHL